MVLHINTKQLLDTARGLTKSMATNTITENGCNNCNFYDIHWGVLKLEQILILEEKLKDTKLEAAK